MSLRCAERSLVSTSQSWRPSLREGSSQTLHDLATTKPSRLNPSSLPCALSPCHAGPCCPLLLQSSVPPQDLELAALS